METTPRLISIFSTARWQIFHQQMKRSIFLSVGKKQQNCLREMRSAEPLALRIIFRTIFFSARLSRRM